MTIDNIAITITGTPDQLAPITAMLDRDGHTVRLVDLPEMLLECDMTDGLDDVDAARRILGYNQPDIDSDIASVDVPTWMAPILQSLLNGRPVNAEPRENRGSVITEVIVDETLQAVSTCRECGCTDDRACPGGCWWANDERDLCTRCAVEEPVSAAVGIDMLAAELAAADPTETVEEVGDDELGDDPTGVVPVGEAPPTSSTTVRPDILDESDAPLADRVEALLAANPDREWTAPLIAEHITHARNNGVISATLSNLIKTGRINRTGRGRYTAPAPVDPAELADDDQDDDEPVPLSSTATKVLEFLRSERGVWTIDGLLIEFPLESRISMRSYLRGLCDRGLVQRMDGETPNTEGTYRAVPA